MGGGGCEDQLDIGEVADVHEVNVERLGPLEGGERQECDQHHPCAAPTHHRTGSNRSLSSSKPKAERCAEKVGRIPVASMLPVVPWRRWS